MQFLKYIFFFTFICIAQYAFCQAEIFIPNIQSGKTSQMGSFQNFLIIDTYENNTSRLIMYNTDKEEPEGTIIFSTEERIVDFDICEHILYFTSINSGVSTLKKIDLLDLDKYPELIPLDGFSPLFIAMNSNRFFISGNISGLPINGRVQSLLEISLDSLEKESFVIADSIEIRDLQMYADTLLILNNIFSSSSIDLFQYASEYKFLTNISRPINDMAIRGNELFLPVASGSLIDSCKAEILKLDLTDVESGADVFTKEFRVPLNVEVNNSHLYAYESNSLCSQLPQQISRLNLDSTIISSTSNQEEKVLLTLYPNPTTDVLIVQDKEPSAYRIYGIDGKLMLDGKVALDRSIDVQTLPTGLFSILFEDGTTARFQKINHN